MTAEQLEILVRWYEQNDDLKRQKEGLGALQVLAPPLARKVLAAEKLVEALAGVRHYIDGYAGSDEQEALDDALTTYREASK